VLVDDMATPLSDALKTLGARVREHRNAMGLSQEALGHASGLHWTFVGQVERGTRNLSLHNLLRLAAALDVDAGKLVTGLRPPEA
jgi:transcriptional regulator with XRE-family HTH domain